MGRLDDIIARNRPKQSTNIIEDSYDPLDTPEDRRRKNLAWAIVGGVIVAIVLLVAILY